MKCELTLKIRDLHACPGDTPPQRITTSKEVSSTDEQEIITETFGEETLSYKEEKKGKTAVKERDETNPFHTFRIEEEKPIARLGGPYGKLMGLFRSAGKSLWAQQDSAFYPGHKAYKAFLTSLIVKPQWTMLEDASEIEIHIIPQILPRSKMIFPRFEKISLCYAKVTIQLPAGEKERFEKLLEQAEGMPFGPKRRGEITVHKMEWI